MNCATSSPPFVQLTNVTKVFGADDRTTAAVREISLQVFPGELVILMGPSGSGKTTLLTLMAGLLRPTGGSVSLFGKNIEHLSTPELQYLRAAQIGFVFQTFLLLDALSVLENVAILPRFAGRSKSESRDRAISLLSRFHVGHLAEKFPSTLSQGEKQRVAISRAIANDAELILADEPTASLETRQGFEIIELLHGLAARERKCVVVASHDFRITEFADRVLKLQDGALKG